MNTDLSAHIAALRKKEAATNSGKKANEALLFWGTALDKPYLSSLRSAVGSYTTYFRLETVDTISQVSLYCHGKGINKVLSTSIPLLEKLLHWEKRKKPSLADYAGSYFTIPTFDGADKIEVVFIQPLKQLVTVAYGQFMAKRIVSKLTKPEVWYKPTAFSFEVLNYHDEETYFRAFSKAFLISIDIETFPTNATIRCLSYTAFYTNGISQSVVLPMDSEWALAIMRKWNWKLQAPKVFQNGKYDNAYLLRYNAPVYRWVYDTQHLFHSWLSELPKDLGFLNAFFIREATYWKDLSETDDLYEYYRYNALDTWGTGNAFLAMVHECPDFALTNYSLEFPLVFPCLLAEMVGIERDMDELVVARQEAEDEIEVLSKQLDKILGVTNFNVKSSPQMKSLFKLLGCSDIKKQDKAGIEKARFRHPLNARILSLVLEIRKQRTAKENYLQVGDDAKEFHRLDGTGNRALFALNPHGTDSSRLASREHHFWCGLNIQKITRGPSVKRTFKADPGFLIAEVDYAQAESRDTAYITGDATLIHNVENSADFHSQNASTFFGIPFEEIFDVTTGEVLNKPIRQLSKATNHGANYNMTAPVLVVTMGERNVAMARQLLELPSIWSYKKVCEYLLEQFHKTYPDIRGVYYVGVIEEVKRTGLLVPKLLNMEGWTRKCFGNPGKSKRHLNMYVAHCPQSLNAQTLNRAYMRVFREVAMNPEHQANFKLGPQIHDSIWHQYRIGHEYLTELVADCMKIPVKIEAYDGVVREFTVPTDIKLCGTHWESVEKVEV